MKWNSWQTPLGLFLVSVIVSPAWAQVAPQAGIINYVEGQSSIGRQVLDESSAGSVRLRAGQSLTTQNGRAEVLLTPGVFFRIGHNSSVDMISPDLANTILLLQKGRALVEVIDIRSQNDIRIDENGASTKLLKNGLYEFDADHAQVRVFKGNAEATMANQKVTLGENHEVTLSVGVKLKS